MDPILGLDPTGRELRDPAARLVEAKGDDDRTYTIIDFDAVHDGHPALTLNVEMVLSFMEFPMVTGLVELGKHDVPNGHFAYPTGSVWLLADILRAFSDFGQIVGLRAAMELAWLVGQILVEAGDTGPVQGCFSHGNLNPWRIALRADGEVQVLGYGLPQVELIRHRNEDGPPIEASSLRYCPPERLEGVPEDASADTYSLTLVCFEVATGKPLYPTHDVSELERMVGMSEGARMLSRDNHGLPPKTAKVLAKALVYDPDTRLSGQDFVDAIGRLLATEPMDGPSLTEVVATLQGHQKAGAPRGRKLVSAADTSMFTPEQLAEMVDDDDSEESEPERESRWKKVDRPRKGDDEPDEPDEPEPKRRARRRGDAEPTKPKRRTRRGEAEPDAEAPPAKPKRSRRRKAQTEAPEAEPEPVVAAPSPTPEPEAPPPAAEPEKAPSSRSRRRKAPRDDAEEPSEAEAKPSRRRKSPAAEDGETHAAPPTAAKASRRRRKAPAEAPAPAPAPAPEGDTEGEAQTEHAPAEVAPAKPSRRRRKAPASDDNASEEPAKPSRRRRKAPAGTDNAPETPAVDETPPPRRRRGPVDEEDEDEAPRRRRRRATPDDDDDDDAPPRRRRKA